jgi:hypothetical protein
VISEVERQTYRTPTFAAVFSAGQGERTSLGPAGCHLRDVKSIGSEGFEASRETSLCFDRCVDMYMPWPGRSVGHATVQVTSMAQNRDFSEGIENEFDLVRSLNDASDAKLS